MYCVDSSLSGGCLMGCVLCLGLLGGIVIVCFVWGGWFVLIGLWCGLECSCRSSGSCCLMVVSGVGLVILSSLGWWVVYFGC